jgi:hypothetical protein
MASRALPIASTKASRLLAPLFLSSPLSLANYGFGVHIRVCWLGLITSFSVAPANAHELSVLPRTPRVHHRVRRRRSQLLVAREEVRAEEERGRRAVRAYRTKKRDPTPQRSALLGRLRYRIDTVFSQRAGRYSVKRVLAKDLWHLSSRLFRKVLSQTVALMLNYRRGNPPPQLATLLH